MLHLAVGVVPYAASGLVAPLWGVIALFVAILPSWALIASATLWPRAPQRFRELTLVAGLKVGHASMPGAGAAGGTGFAILLAGGTLTIGGTAVGLAFLATLYPSWWAARVKPAEALRYE